MFSLFKKTDQESRRNNPRHPASQFMAVYDEEKLVLLGRIDDLTIDGVCVSSETNIQLGNRVKLGIEVTHHNGDTETLWLRCESLWQQDNGNKNLNKIGFRFIDPSPEIINKIQRIIS